MIFEAAINERKPDIIPPAPIDRILRTIAGAAFLGLGWWNGNSWVLYGLGVGLVFSAFYDRCPIFKAIVPRVKALFSRTGG
jgi:hypothetical protein